MLTNKRNAFFKALFRNAFGVAENDRRRIFNLIVEKFAKVFHIHLAAVSVNNCCKAVELHFVILHRLNRTNNIAELADARRLNDDSVRGILINYLCERRCKIADKTAANAARIHLGNIDSRILHESAVNSDFAEFIFDQNKLFSAECFFDQLFNKRSFACAQKTRKNVYFSHYINHFLLFF